MSHMRALERVRTFLHVMALGLFIGTMAELLSVKHYGETIKLVPFALCILGCVAVAAAWLRPGRRLLLGVRIVMVVTMLGSLLGVYEHIEGNLEFAKEVHRHATTVERIKQVLTGRNPLAAPGMLAVAALLLIAATFVMQSLSKPLADDTESATLSWTPTPMRSSRTA